MKTCEYNKPTCPYYGFSNDEENVCLRGKISLTGEADCERVKEEIKEELLTEG